MFEAGEIDYYDILEITPAAEPEAILRVLRLLESRYAPENRATGDASRYRLVKLAGETLTDRRRRADYDAARARRQVRTSGIFACREYFEGLEGEQNRRLGILAVLYSLRRLNPERPGLSVLQLESRMSLPREHLTFAIGYLRETGLVSEAENNDLVITAAGMDRLESQLTKQHPLYAYIWPVEARVGGQEFTEVGPADVDQS